MTTSSPLVTGATGFAGSHLIDHLLEHEPHVFAWGNPQGREIPSARQDRVTWTAVDVTDVDAVTAALTAARPSAIYHCAGFADVHSAWSRAADALRVNALGTHALLTALERARLDAPVLVTGSALVYRPSLDALAEDAPLEPSSPYGVSKLAQEMIAAAGPGRVVIARPFNHAGPRQSAAYATSSFARQIAEIEAGLHEPVLRVGNLDARRDLTDVRDTVRAYVLLVARGQGSRPYNVCRGEAYRMGDLLDALVGGARVGITVEVDQARLRPSDNPTVLGDPGRIRSETGWVPRIPIERTLSDLLDYWRGVIARGDPGA
jgi:GDP-4-dehydro-6-deoxy-D-mannose reductase